MDSGGFKMLRKFKAIVLLMCTMTYAAASTISIGTVNARGDMRIDGNLVNGNATLFDGTVVETGTATADLRLAKGVEFTLSPNSRTTLHSNYLLLERGQTEISGAGSFKVEANGLTVSPLESHSRALISIKADNTTEVASLNGSFGISNGQGSLISTVRPGRSLLFAKQTSTSHSTSFSGQGTVSVDKDGFYFFFTDKGGTFQLVGKDLKDFLGYEVKVTGTVQPGVKPVMTATEVVSVNTIKIVQVVAEAGSDTSLIVGGIIVVSGAGIGVGIYKTSQNKSSASP